MRETKRAVLLFVILLLLTGVLYPLVVTVLARVIFPRQAGGSLVYKADGVCIGSSLIGQSFSDPRYFWSRPSATADFPYNPLASGGSNLGPTNSNLLEQIEERVTSVQSTGIIEPFPADLVMASGSGLDPHISMESAIIQIPRVARERHIPEEKVRQLVQNSVEDRQFGLLGTKRVNVLKLNLALDNY
jgi:potassium-transporting ATPase KdpC subunit